MISRKARARTLLSSHSLIQMDHKGKRYDAYSSIFDQTVPTNTFILDLPL